MALSIVNNTASLTAQSNLNKTSASLGASLQRLSTGLKINSGADGPAALVISKSNRAQIAGLQTALDNTNKAVSLAQTGEGALNEINTSEAASQPLSGIREAATARSPPSRSFLSAKRLRGRRPVAFPLRVRAA